MSKAGSVGSFGPLKCTPLSYRVVQNSKLLLYYYTIVMKNKVCPILTKFNIHIPNDILMKLSYCRNILQPTIYATGCVKSHNTIMTKNKVCLILTNFNMLIPNDPLSK